MAATASFPAERLTVSTLAERPELRAQAFSAQFHAAVPELMLHDPVAALYYADAALDRYLEFVLVAVDRDDPGRAIARAVSVPFAMGDDIPERSELPDGGWDEIIRWGHEDHIASRPANAVSALEIMVLPPYRGRGLSQLMLAKLRDNTRARGFADLYGSVRPTEKHLEPLTSFADYVAQTRADGLPRDSWVRAHLRIGGRIVKVAPCSMVVAGTLAEWRQWTGLRFDRSGDVVVPGALVPVHVSLEQNHAVYIEPNLWIHHPVGE
jgi:GNAT superfamily N-acetyltransferase